MNATQLEEAIGNAIFRIETNFDSLKNRLRLKNQGNQAQGSLNFMADTQSLEDAIVRDIEGLKTLKSQIGQI